MRVHPKPRPSGLVVGDDIDTDRRTTVTRLHDVRTGKARRRHAFGQRDSWQHLQPGRAREGAEHELVHPDERTGGVRSGIGNPDQVEDTLQRAVLAGTTVAADQHRINLDELFLGPEPPASLSKETPTRARHQPQRHGAGWRAVYEGRALGVRRDLEPLSGLRPVERVQFADVGDLVEAVDRLQSREDRDVVLGRRTSVDDSDPRKLSA